MVKRILIVIVIALFALPVMAQGSEVADAETLTFIEEYLLAFLMGVVSLLIVLAIAYITGGGTITKTNLEKSAITLADFLSYLERLDLTDEFADAKIKALREAVEKTVEDMGSSAEVILVKDK